MKKFNPAASPEERDKWGEENLSGVIAEINRRQDGNPFKTLESKIDAAKRSALDLVDYSKGTKGEKDALRRKIDDYFSAVQKAAQDYAGERIALRYKETPRESAWITLPSGKQVEIEGEEGKKRYKAFVAEESRESLLKAVESLREQRHKFVEKVAANKPDEQLAFAKSYKDAEAKYQENRQAADEYEKLAQKTEAYIKAREERADAKGAQLREKYGLDADEGNDKVFSLSFRERLGKFASSISDFIKSKVEPPQITPYDEEERKNMRKGLFERSDLFKQITEEKAPITIEESEKQMEKMIAKADYSHCKNPVELEYANLVNRETARFFETFGDSGTLLDVVFVDHLNLEVAQYDENKRRINIQNYTLPQLQKKIDKMHKAGHWKSTSPGDIIWHELGHSYMTWLKTDVNFGARYYYARKLADEYKARGVWKQSDYGNKNPDEFFAELMADKHANPKSKEVDHLLRVFFDTDFVTTYNEALNGIRTV